ncbi:MAG: DegV family protein [Treponema sp.]|nr:DegV family protein [Treponema sp.]
MRPVKIITDSCSDLPKDLREKYDIDYVRMKTVYEGKETWASLDFEYYTPKELYDIMRAGNRVFTNQVPTEEFERVFGSYLEKGMDIIYIGCCLKQSGSVNTGAVVRRKLLEKYTDANVFCVDSLNACIGEGMLAIRCAEYRDQGMDAKTIYEKIIPERKTVNEFVTVHTLDCLKRAGRVKASSAFFGNLFGVKPILIADYEGNQFALKKVKGRQASLQEVVSLMKEAVIKPEEQTCYLMHADCEEEAKELAEIVKKEIPFKEIKIGLIGPIIGASVGPDTIGLWAFGKEVTTGKTE